MVFLIIGKAVILCPPTKQPFLFSLHSAQAALPTEQKSVSGLLYISNTIRTPDMAEIRYGETEAPQFVILVSSLSYVLWLIPAHHTSFDAQWSVDKQICRIRRQWHCDSIGKAREAQ